MVSTVCEPLSFVKDTFDLLSDSISFTGTSNLIMNSAFRNLSKAFGEYVPVYIPFGTYYFVLLKL